MGSVRQAVLEAQQAGEHARQSMRRGRGSEAGGGRAGARGGGGGGGAGGAGVLHRGRVFSSGVCGPD